MLNHINENGFEETYNEPDDGYLDRVRKESADLRKKLKDDYFEKTFDFDIEVLFEGKNPKNHENPDPSYGNDVELAETIANELSEKMRELMIINIKKKLGQKTDEQAIDRLSEEVGLLEKRLADMLCKYPDSPEINFFSMAVNYGFDNEKFIKGLRMQMSISDKYKNEIYKFFRSYIIELGRDGLKGRGDSGFELQELVFGNFHQEVGNILRSVLLDSAYPVDIKDNFKKVLDHLDMMNR